jgi:anthranilate synthase component I
MNHHPTFETFTNLAENGNLIPVYRQLLSDTLTPVSAYCKLEKSECSFLFESVIGGEKIGRYSFLGSNPFFQINAYGTKVILNDGTGDVVREINDPLQELESLLSKFKAVPLPGIPSFCGGAVGYAGYDVIRYSESLPDAPHDDRQLPDLSFAFYDHMVIFDHINKTILVVAHARTDTEDPQKEYDRACKQVDSLCDQLMNESSGIQMKDIQSGGEPQKEWESNFEKEEFISAVENCKEYIRAGDIFQVVLSQRFQRKTKASPLDIYRALRVVNPSPFMFLLKLKDHELVGSSPEIMVRVDEGKTTIRPLAGTRVRGKDEAEDQKLAEELLADPKERAEHVMLIDLARNDVGRIAQYGSVELSDVMVVEKYSHVMHITSNVTGQLRDELTALEALRAGLPAGTVSGAPKIRAMEIIDEFELNRRGPYAGAVGYIDFTGNMDTCIALRTLVMKNQIAYVQAGAGLVADSIPEKEFDETVSKAKGLFKAIEVAEQQVANSNS